MNRLPALVACFTFIAYSTCLGFTAARAEFNHPGISHTQPSLEFVRAKIAGGEQPWTTAFERVQSSRYADLDWQPRPRAHVERGPSNNPNIGSSDFSADASAAYHHAVLWALTEKKAHAEKAAEILNAWTSTLKSISNHDARLLVGMEGYEYCNAAELLKHTWGGWPKSEQNTFEKMLREVFYPVIKDFYPSANGNWDASMLQTMLAMGVYLDDRSMFDRGVDYYINGKGNGAIGNYFKPSGQCQESGRDQAHTQMGLDYLACTAEIAWNQGVDLYGALDNRLLKGFEYTAKYNLGFDVPYEPYRSFEGRYHYKSISNQSRGRLRPMYEKVLNHYEGRKGLEAPFTRQAAMRLRESSAPGEAQRENDRTRAERDGRGRDRRNRNGRRSSRRDSSAMGTLMFSGQSA
ncbi:alginate lyase family protein [Rhodopirellula sp. JC639]|uniref:alginate lyase family protein n=1 Tax=Stieleria mannarensis TaxID=2755585 RepID=UPI001603167B|nr:alginate lyase family protein [Rhodopirellula sp. JC639]